MGVAGRRPGSRMALVPCIAISTGYILLVLFLCELARKVIAPLNPGLVKTALNEAIAAADLCGCCFELIIIADNYGLAAYGLYLFLLTIWWSMKWGDATACPYNHFEECVQGNMIGQETAVRTVAQTLGGIAVFRVIQVLWSLEIAETHVGRSHSAVYNVCSADLTVPVLHGAIIEGVATSTPSSQPPSSSDAGATPRWSTLLSTGWDTASAPSPPSPSGLMLKRPSL